MKLLQATTLDIQYFHRHYLNATPVSPWHVKTSQFDPKEKRLDIYIDFEK
jgi:hypothetical protein